MTTTTCARGGLTELRLRRLIFFLRRNRLYATAHALERQTGVFFDAAHLRRLLLHDRCAAASSYALRFVTVGDCSPEADALNVRILILRVISDFAAGRSRARAVDPLFQRLHAALDAYPNCAGLRKVLLSMRSDDTKAFRLYRHIKPKAVEVIMDMVAKCPELQAKARLPHCTFDPAYIMSLGPGLWGCTTRRNYKIGHIPAHVIARSFLRKRPPQISHKTNQSDVPSAPIVQGMPATSPRPANSFSDLIR
uniref:Uncharacterized protein n=1 Tax=Arundo donax TaxID=35708 RepID=A0A0A9CZV1_ARUDO